ncbi:hypothetical protein ACQ4PT_052830 [Festuca glaucescens]
MAETAHDESTPSRAHKEAAAYMAHLLRSVLYPNGEPSRAAQVGSSSSSNPDPRRRLPTGSLSGGAGVPSAQPNRASYNNPPVFFTQDPEIEEPAPSGFVADSILRGFDLNNAALETSYAPETSAAGKFVPGPQSAASASATSAAQEYEEEILSQPMVPYVGMTFDDIEEAREVYNNYAYKLGFGTHIGNTKYSTARHAPKGTILSRVFECVHAGKPSDGTTKTTRSKSEGSVAMDMSSFSAQKSKVKQATEQMDVKGTRQRNIVLRHDSKAHMVVGMRCNDPGWSIEKQGVFFYTREVFDRFQKMLQMSTGFYPLRAEVEELCFDLVPNPGLDLKTYRVQVGLEEETYACGCNQFEMCGLICPHIIRVLVHMNVRSIPEKYMLHRRAMEATTPVPDPGSTGGKFGVPMNNTLKYNSLCRKLNSLAADSCIADDTYAVVLDMVDEAKNVVAAMHRARVAGQQGQEEEEGNTPEPRAANVHLEQQQHGCDQKQQQQEQPVAQETPSISNLRNPTRVKPKGSPSEKEQRRKPLVELRDEANKKRKKRAKEPKVMKEPKPKRPARKKKCPFCNEEGHNLKQCEYMLLAKQFKDAKDAELEKTL